MIQGEFTKALNLLAFYEKDQKNLTPQNQLSCMLLKSKVLYNLFKLEEALALINQIITKSKVLKEDLIYVDALLIKAGISAQMGKLDDCREIIDQTTDFVSHSPLKDTTDYIQRIGLIHNYKGGFYWLKGELNKALQNYQIGLELGTKCKDEFVIGASLSNIGAMYWRKGDLSKALRFLEESLVQFTNMKAKLESAAVLGNLGEVFHQKGDFYQALEYHQHSLDIFKKLNNVWYTSKELFYLISVNIDLGLNGKKFIEKAEDYLQELEEISMKENSRTINQRFKVAKGSILKTSTRTRDKGKAETIFQEIVDEEILDHEVSIVAFLNLCDLHFMELRVSGDLEILLEVQSLVNRLFEIAKKQPSYLLLSNAFLLKSKLALIQLDTNKAKNYLNQAQQICEDKGLDRLAMLISNEYDVLLSQLTKWEEFIDRNAPLEERLEFTEFERIVDQMLKKKMKELPKESKDEPVSILILEERGTTIFSKHFSLDSYTMADDQIMGGFLTAINTFMQKAFSTTGDLERIKYKDYTLILKTNTPFTFCYMFKGQSYSAMKKLNQFITQIKQTDSIWASFLRYVQTTILPAEPEKRALETIAEKIFT